MCVDCSTNPSRGEIALIQQEPPILNEPQPKDDAKNMSHADNLQDYPNQKK